MYSFVTQLILEIVIKDVYQLMSLCLYLIEKKKKYYNCPVYPKDCRSASDYEVLNKKRRIQGQKDNKDTSVKLANAENKIPSDII